MESFKQVSWTQAVLAIVLVLVAYVYGLNSPRIPTIGDEIAYMEIARVTKASGDWLPLRDERGVWNTKPPGLFWQGMLTTPPSPIGAARWQYRWPSVVCTFLVALLLYFFVREWSRRERWRHQEGAPWLAALLYLGFISTYQHGRPFLMHPWEQLGLVTPVFMVLLWGWSWPVAVATGFFWGVAAFYKSFALVAVGGLSLLAVLLTQRDKTFSWIQAGSRLAVSGSIGLACFALWFVLDPSPQLIVDQFIVGENVGKFAGISYWEGLLRGPYPLLRIWLGSLTNSGLLAPVLLGLWFWLFRKRGQLSRMDRSLLWFILVFLLFYSLPKQRQENYLLPAMLMWAALLAKFWNQIPPIWFRASAFMVGALSSLVLFAIYQISAAMPQIPFLTYTALLLVVLGFLGFLLSSKAGWVRAGLPFLILLMSHGLTVVGDNLWVPFPPEVVARLSQQTVVMPSNFRYAHSGYQFDLPGAVIRGYTNSEDWRPFFEQGAVVALPEEQVKQLASAHKLETYFSFPVLRERMTSDELRKIILSGDFAKFMRPLFLVQTIP